ncbi:MAG: hypothetical protein FJZ00_05115 [Candidatus Sericytochromatia bacterium]|uniref:Uncharacterized protein n=1 Tax=Candidatus Tanganyikabacteria bacterium TaxID=2961651 RepID=A0A937X251_9BACT|nr:hypothetical protein [Candidatus Tanganyikabacteria bacterium]
MIAAERDARRADVRAIRGDIHVIGQRLNAIDKRFEESDERTTGFEGAVSDALSSMANKHEALEGRVISLEDWRDDIEKRRR